MRQLLRAHEYWRMKQLAVDLVILNERGSSYIQDLQAALEAQVRMSQSRLQSGADLARGAVFVLRADLIPAETRALLLAMARAVLVGRRGTLSEQLSRLQEADAASAATSAPPRAPAVRGLIVGRCSGAAEPRVLQRPRGIHRGRPRVRDDPRCRAVDTGPVDQRHRQSRLRLPGRGRGQRLHLVGIQPREPAHALVERSGHRPAGRGSLCARRGLRHAVGADRPADPRRDRALRRQARPGIQPVRARRTRHRARPPPVRAARRSGQALAPDDPEYVAAGPAAFGHCLCRVGARPVARRVGALARDGDRSGNGRDVRAQPVEHRVRFPRRLRRPRWTADRLDRRPAGIPGTERHARQSRRARRGRAALAAGGRRPRSLRRPAGAGRARARRDGGARLPPRAGGDGGRCASR